MSDFTSDTDFPLPGAVPAAHPASEPQRIRALQETAVLDTAPEQVYDDLTALAAHICGTPIALISLVDTERQWFKSRVGLAATETPRDLAFCAHALLEPKDLFEVRDARADARFTNNPLVTASPEIRFYAGSPLLSDEGLPLGTLCVIDRKPKELDEYQRAALRTLGRLASHLLIERRRAELARLAPTQMALEAELRRLVLLDAVTGVHNRRAFDERFEQEFLRAARGHGSLGLLMIDIDCFKLYNDSYGHPAGDKCLRQVAQALSATLKRPSDFVARYGGEEFAVLLPDADIAGCKAAADLLLARVRELALPHPGAVKDIVSISIGAAVAKPPVRGELESFMAKADQRLYKAKQAGRDRVVWED